MTMSAAGAAGPPTCGNSRPNFGCPPWPWFEPIVPSPYLNSPTRVDASTRTFCCISATKSVMMLITRPLCYEIVDFDLYKNRHYPSLYNIMVQPGSPAGSPFSFARVLLFTPRSYLSIEACLWPASMVPL